MGLSRSGDIRPIQLVELEADEEHRIGDLCPGIHLEHRASEGDMHPIWGPLLRVRTGHSTDESIRREGSSGGVISALAVYLLETFQVDFVAQISVSPSDPLTNTVQMSRSRSDVLRAAGSRYAPAAPLDRLEEFLASGQRFAVVGKPCDIAALRNISRTNPRIDQQIPFMLSFMCAGVPSMKGTQELLSAIGMDSRRLQSFRYRGDGWPGMARAISVDGQVAEMDYAKSWGTILNRHLQFRCKICPDGTGEFADVVCADAWYGKDGYPDFAERAGRSLVISRTARGESLLLEATKAGAIGTADLATSEIDRMQPYQLNRKKQVLARLLGTRLRQGWAPTYRNLGLLRAAVCARPIDLIRSAVGTFKRATGEVV